MEQAFGADFASVRVHTGTQANDLAHSLGAKAVTSDEDIAFSAGRYQPDSPRGRNLLAHELAHVVQQRQGGASDRSESRARSAVQAISAGGSVAPRSLGGAESGALHCDPDDERKPAETSPSATAFKMPPLHLIPPLQLRPLSPPATAAGAGSSDAAASFRMPPLQLTPPLQLSPMLPAATGTGTGTDTTAPMYDWRAMRSLLPPEQKAEGPQPLPSYRLPSPFTRPAADAAGTNSIDWLAMRKPFDIRGLTLTQRDGDTITEEAKRSAAMLDAMGMDKRFKFGPVTQEWLINLGLGMQLDQVNARDNPNAMDRMQLEWKNAYPDEKKTPILPVFNLDWFRKK
ncbi:hypothetical protein HEP74_04006 [Xanthomonas sp. SS]|nr:hypothetical protein HEP74_04006 [Xanthomonas sp. SS]